MKIVVQQRASGLFFKRATVWVRQREEAREFSSAAAAINHCVSLGIRDVHLAVFSYDWEFEGCLWPFGNAEVREESRNLRETNRELREEQRALIAELEWIEAETKERKKQIAFVQRKRDKPAA